MRAQGAPPLQIEKMLTPFIAMPLKALSPKHSHAEARAVAPAGGRREGGGRETSSINSIAHVFGMAVQGVRAGWAYSETVVSQGTTLMQRVRHSPGS